MTWTASRCTRWSGTRTATNSIDTCHETCHQHKRFCCRAYQLRWVKNSCSRNGTYSRLRARTYACECEHVFVYCMCMCCMCVQLSAAQKQHTIPHRNLNALTQNHKLARYHASNCMSVCVGLSSSRRHVQQRLHDHRLYAKLLCINFRHVCVAPACCKTSERVGCLDIPMQCVFVFVCALNKKRKCKQISSAFSLYYYAFFLVKDPWAQLRCT